MSDKKHKPRISNLSQHIRVVEGQNYETPQWGKAVDVPQPQPWDQALLDRKKKAREEWLKRWPGGYIPRTR